MLDRLSRLCLRWFRYRPLLYNFQSTPALIEDHPVFLVYAACINTFILTFGTRTILTEAVHAILVGICNLDWVFVLIKDVGSLYSSIRNLHRRQGIRQLSLIFASAWGPILLLDVSIGFVICFHNPEGIKNWVLRLFFCFLFVCAGPRLLCVKHHLLPGAHFFVVYILINAQIKILGLQEPRDLVFAILSLLTESNFLALSIFEIPKLIIVVSDEFWARYLVSFLLPVFVLRLILSLLILSRGNRTSVGCLYLFACMQLDERPICCFPDSFFQRVNGGACYRLAHAS